MSRETSANPKTYLVVKNGQAVVRSQPFGYGSRETDFAALATFSNILPFIKKTKMPYEVWLLIMHYLLADNIRPFVPPVFLLPAFEIESEKKLRKLRQSLVTVASNANGISTLFPSAIRHQTYEMGCLLNAALSGDLAIVKMILKTCSYPRTLLNTVGEATTDSGITQTGTALELALMANDDEMANEIKKYLHPTECQHQFENVFGPDFSDFLKQQKQEALSLLEEVESAFEKATETEMVNIIRRVPNTNSVLQEKITNFQTKLASYVQLHRVHNPYILEKAYKIYGESRHPWKITLHGFFLFSRSIIGQIQQTCFKTSSVWSMHIAHGIANYSDKNPARRSFFLMDAPPSTDIRSIVNLGSRSWIDMSGYLMPMPINPLLLQSLEEVIREDCEVEPVTKIIRNKNLVFEKFAKPSKTKESCNCLMM